MTPLSYQKVIQIVWEIAGKQGLRDFNAEYIAQKAGLSTAEVRLILPNKTSVILLLIADILAKIEIGKSSLLSKSDYLFDTLMQGFDQAEPHKIAIQKIWADLKSNPWLLVQVLPAFQKKLREMEKALEKQDSWLQIILSNLALQAIFIKVFLTWVEDETLDQAKTMAALDQSIKHLMDSNLIKAAFKKPFVE